MSRVHSEGVVMEQPASISCIAWQRGIPGKGMDPCNWDAAAPALGVHLGLGDMPGMLSAPRSCSGMFG